MDRRLFQPRWLIAHATVLAIAVVFVLLGMWQLRRLDERKMLNQRGESRISLPAQELETLLITGEPAELEFRRATVTGTFLPDLEVLIRSQVYLGSAGFDVVTPMLMDDGTAVLVNRGWVPLDFELLPTGELTPPVGPTTIEGWVHLTEEKPTFGPVDPTGGVLEVFNRVDVGRIGEQLPVDVAPVYVVLIGERGSDLPVPVALPTFADQGPHLAYAIQWFGFAIVGLVGYFFLARRRLRSTSGESPPA